MIKGFLERISLPAMLVGACGLAVHWATGYPLGRCMAGVLAANLFCDLRREW